MKVVLASDHAGFDLKQMLIEHLVSLGHQPLDAGAYNSDASDYPDFAEALAARVLSGEAERGILVCGSGIGASVAANKIPGIRAGLAHDEYSAHQGVEHDDMNVLVLGSRVVGTALARELAERFLSAQFTHEERHVRRLGKVKAIEQRYKK